MYWVIDAPLHGAYFPSLVPTRACYATIASILSRRHPKFKGLLLAQYIGDATPRAAGTYS